MNENIPVKIISPKEAEEQGLARKTSVSFMTTAIGKIGHQPHDVEIHNLETGEKAHLMKDGIKQDFKGFKNK